MQQQSQGDRRRLPEGSRTDQVLKTFGSNHTSQKMSKEGDDSLEYKRQSPSLELVLLSKSEQQMETVDVNNQRQQNALGLSDMINQDLFVDSEDESGIQTARVSMQGAIEEDQKQDVRHSPLSLQLMDEAELNEDEDDFMETYLAMNSELKVRESQGGGHITRNNAGHASARNDSKTSRYKSRLEIKSATNTRPLSKNRDKNPSRAQSNQEISTINEDNFDQYNDRVDRHSVEESFNQYENLDKFLENDKRQAERRQVALKAIHDYKIMAIEQQRSVREDKRHIEQKKQQEANRLISKLRKERQLVKDKNRKKLQEQLERNISRLQQQETNFEIMQAKILLSKAEDQLRKSQESEEIQEYDPTTRSVMRNRNAYSLKPTKAQKSLLEQIPENQSVRDSMNKSVLQRVNQKSALKPLHSTKPTKPLYKQFEIRHQQQKEEDERERQRKLREHRQQYQVVSFKNLQARALDLSYDERLKQRQRMARGGVNQFVPEGLQVVEVIKNESMRPNVNHVIKKLSAGEQNDTTFGPVHFVKELRVSGQKQSPNKKVVELDDNLRGRVEKFQYAQAPQQGPTQQSHSKERKQHVQKYSQYVNEINRKSPSFGSPSSRFDAEDYKKVFKRQLMREMKEEEVQKINNKQSKSQYQHQTPQSLKQKKVSSLEANPYFLKSPQTSKRSENLKVTSFDRAPENNFGQDQFKIEPKQIILPSIYERRSQVEQELPYLGNPHPTIRRQQFLSSENTFNPQMPQISFSPYQQVVDQRGVSNPRSSLNDHSLQNLRLQETQFQPPEVRLQNLFSHSQVGSGLTNRLDGVEAIRNKLEILSSLMV